VRCSTVRAATRIHAENGGRSGTGLLACLADPWMGSKTGRGVLGERFAPGPGANHHSKRTIELRSKNKIFQTKSISIVDNFECGRVGVRIKRAGFILYAAFAHLAGRGWGALDCRPPRLPRAKWMRSRSLTGRRRQTDCTILNGNRIPHHRSNQRTGPHTLSATSSGGTMGAVFGAAGLELFLRDIGGRSVGKKFNLSGARIWDINCSYVPEVP